MADANEGADDTMRNVIVFTILVAALGYAWWSTNNTTVADKTSSVQATDFTLPTLSGSDMSLSDTRGKVTILNFWASWCGPCQQEMPHFQQIVDTYNDVSVVAVNVTTKDTKADAKAFVADYGLTFPILLDETGDVSTMYGAFSIPLTVILTKDGHIAHEIMGPLDTTQLTALIKPLQ